MNASPSMSVPRGLGKFIGICISLLLAAGPCSAAMGSPADESVQQARPIWEAFKKNFIQGDGRVIDTFQENFSHSEAQAFGMLLALKFHDRSTFDIILRWTEDNMQMRKGDHLLCWSWGKRIQGHWQVRDYNNASDGDILAAWALLMAWEEWHEQIYREKALAIIKDIRRLLFADLNGTPVLLPGYSGFVKGMGSIEYNPSYFIPAAFRAFAVAGHEPEFWSSAIKTGFNLQGACCFGKFSMPANWVKLQGEDIIMPERKPFRYGFDAVRIWLYTAQWLENEGNTPSGAASFLARLEKFLEFFDEAKWIPAEIGLKDNFVSTDDAPAGFYMIYSRAMQARGNVKLAQKLRKRAIEKIHEEQNNYYSCSLFLLALY